MQEQKVKIRVLFPDGAITEYESNTIAVVATAKGGTNSLLYTEAPLSESLMLLNGLNKLKKTLLNSHPLLAVFGEKLAEGLDGYSTDDEINRGCNN